MKKTFALLMAVVMCLTLCACGTPSEPHVDESDNTTITESTCRRDRMSESEKEEEASRAAVLEVARRLENQGYYLDNAGYKIGSVIKVEENVYEVSGIIYVYDKLFHIILLDFSGRAGYNEPALPVMVGWKLFACLLWSVFTQGAFLMR